MPTLICVPIMVRDDASALADANAAKLAGADLVEYRIDEFFDGSLEAPAGGPNPIVLAIERLVSQSPLPCIVTCRHVSEGGGYSGEDAERVSLYQRLGTAPAGRAPAYLDIELAAYARSANIKQKVNLAVQHAGQLRDVGPALILSTHDFVGRPADLTRRVLAMNSEPAAAVVKFAYRARSIRDNLELFELLVQRQKPMIALAMGEFGLLSRILAPKFGGFLTFAALRPAGVTAPGQPTIRDLLDLYRFRAISASTRVYGIIGWPVAHSLSPLVHNAAFEAMDVDGVYVPMPIPTPEGGEASDAYLAFKATVLDFVHDPQLTFRGASVTLPHKEHLVRLAEEQGWAISETARGVGAANTLTVTRNARGDYVSASIDNTDVAGVINPLEIELGSLAGVRVAVVGAGGAARAAVYGLLRRGARVSIYNRDAARAETLARDLAPHTAAGVGAGAGVTAHALGDLGKSDSSVFINCTPVGMKHGPAPDEVPLPITELSRSGNWGNATIVFDTVYNPVETPLLREARAAGARVIDGVRMFVRQAMLQSHAWTGHWPSEGLFDRLVRESLGASRA